MRVNLIRAEKRQVSFDYFGVILLLAVLIPILAVGLMQYSLIQQRNLLESQIETTEEQLDIFLPQEEEFKEYEEIVAALKETPTVPNYNWDGPIEALGYVVPIRGVIDNFSLSASSLNIRGRTRVGEELREFTVALADSPYFTNVQLDTMEKQEVVTFTVTADIIVEEGE
ncbi:MAG: PilN domain-containing protein [Bacillota bacterium]